MLANTNSHLLNTVNRLRDHTRLAINSMFKDIEIHYTESPQLSGCAIY